MSEPNRGTLEENYRHGRRMIGALWNLLAVYMSNERVGDLPKELHREVSFYLTTHSAGVEESDPLVSGTFSVRELTRLVAVNEHHIAYVQRLCQDVAGYLDPLNFPQMYAAFHEAAISPSPLTLRELIDEFEREIRPA